MKKNVSDNYIYAMMRKLVKEGLVVKESTINPKTGRAVIQWRLIKEK